MRKPKIAICGIHIIAVLIPVDVLKWHFSKPFCTRYVSFFSSLPIPTTGCEYTEIEVCTTCLYDILHFVRNVYCNFFGRLGAI